jgi:putative ABC transport system permease protein
VIGVRWRKVWRDVATRPGRSALTVLAMATGIFQITTMLYTYALLQPELTSMYGRTRPASATLYLDAADDSVVDVVRAVPGVAAAEARPVVIARALVRGAGGDAGGDEWVPLVLFVVRDFDRLQRDTFRPDGGAWPPGPGDVLLERSALQVAKVVAGDSLRVRRTGEEDGAVHVAGTVWAAGLAPAWMEHQIPGFVAWNSTLRGGASESAQIRIVADHPLDEGAIHEAADRAKRALEARGHEVTRVVVPIPGKHPHADQMAAFLFLLLSFGVLSFALSAVLVASTTQALMAEQVKQVGVMKAIGGTDRQVAGLYLAHVALLAALALAIGVPLGLWAGRGYALFSAGILNADIVRDGFPVWVVLVAVAGGLLVPLLVALGPVARAARITVREALGDEGGAGAAATGTGGLARALADAAWLPRPLAFSLRATLGRRGRLAVTVGMLALGGAAFLSALNVADAWIRAVNADFSRRRYDLTVVLAASQRITAVDSLLAGVEGVERTEYWSSAQPYLVDRRGVAGSPTVVLGLPPETRLLALPITSGRWLAPGEVEGAVVYNALVGSHGALAVGVTVRVRLDEATYGFPVRGVVKELAPMGTIYVPRAKLLAIAGLPGERTRTVRIVTARHDDAAQRGAARRVEAAFRDAGIEVSSIQRMEDAKQGILDHLVIILSILTMASTVVVVVGVLGLTSALALGVVQRTREFGVLSAIGATPGAVARVVWFEALALGALGWAASLVIALPISWALESIVGNIFFRAPLEFYVSPVAAAAWLGIALVLASIASLAPARRAAGLSVREALTQT